MMGATKIATEDIPRPRKQVEDILVELEPKK